MSFQWIFDNATNISIIRRPIVSQTTSRDQRIRAISRGGNIWRFKVTMPNGLRWQENSSNIAQVDYANLLTPEYINMSKPAYNYIMGYKGNIPSGLYNIQFHGVAGSEIATLSGVSSSGVGSGYLFRAGDFIQPVPTGYADGQVPPNAAGHVYSLAQDYKVSDLSGGNLSVRLNRPYLGEFGTETCNTNIGSQVTWKVVCTQCPTWTINPGGLVSWSGSFEFAESLL